VQTTGERVRASDFSSSGGSVAYPLGGGARPRRQPAGLEFFGDAYLGPRTARFTGMTNTLRTSLRAWAQRPSEAFVQNLRLRAQTSPYQALSRRLRTAGTR
jgi:hypothetical protein